MAIVVHAFAAGFRAPLQQFFLLSMFVQTQCVLFSPPLVLNRAWTAQTTHCHLWMIFRGAWLTPKHTFDTRCVQPSVAPLNTLTRNRLERGEGLASWRTFRDIESPS